ncbi:hypothetical protein DFH27DRAFT_610050 [Peziza echinospora]|nr:hypothetical protein DFH27DRAFT_610050 [Peziza echinospora]
MLALRRTLQRVGSRPSRPTIRFTSSKPPPPPPPPPPKNTPNHILHPHPLPRPLYPPPTHPSHLLTRPPIPPVPDLISPTPTRLLTMTLQPHLFPLVSPPYSPETAFMDEGVEIPPGHHLVYFPAMWCGEGDVMDGDGGDGMHYPGGGVVRRLWGGGEVEFADAGRKGGGLRVGEGGWCVERVVGVEWVGEDGRRGGGEGGEGDGGEVKLKSAVVKLERRYYGVPAGEVVRPSPERFIPTPPPIAPKEEKTNLFTGFGPNNDGEGWAVREVRTLIFLPKPPPPPPPPTSQEGEKKPQDTRRYIPPPSSPPDFTHTFLPTPHLLARFSALTFNIHRIHIDEGYAVHEEGLPGMLCHGPLSMVVLLEVLGGWLKGGGVGVGGGMGGEVGRRWRIKSLTYRNLVMMVAGEGYRVCGRVRRGGGGGEEETVEGGRRTRTYDLWVLTPRGGMSVKGVAEVEEVPVEEE